MQNLPLDLLQFFQVPSFLKVSSATDAFHKLQQLLLPDLRQNPMVGTLEDLANRVESIVNKPMSKNQILALFVFCVMVAVSWQMAACYFRQQALNIRKQQAILDACQAYLDAMVKDPENFEEHWLDFKKYFPQDYPVPKTLAEYLESAIPPAPHQPAASAAHYPSSYCRACSATRFRFQ